LLWNFKDEEEKKTGFEGKKELKVGRIRLEKKGLTDEKKLGNRVSALQ